MPHISIKMYPGRTEEVKKDLAEKTKDFICQEMNMEEKYISVSVEEIEKDKWNEEVVDKINPDDLYVKAKRNDRKITAGVNLTRNIFHFDT